MAYEGLIRGIFFFTVLVLVAYAEIRCGRRQLTVSKTGRWFNNLGIIFLSSLFLKLAIPIAATGVAAVAAAKGWGLFNYLELSLWLTIPISILILDLVIYLQHLMFHAVPILWRLHMVHHADLDLDVTSGLRFHPLEIILSMGIKMAVVAALGIPIIAVLVFEITLNATAMFNHGNIHLPDKLDRYLRLLTVTPDMHRVHHSVLIRETNSNFGFNFPWWDRLCGTYRAQPAAGHNDMIIGLSQFRKVEQVTLLRLLILPFSGDEGRYSLKYIGKDPTSQKRGYDNFK
ncbi:MAG: sterol desaturase family protein [Anaerolineales bacterium]|nr:sterol desaturase family protein [Anaerolineales bacterium]